MAPAIIIRIVAKIRPLDLVEPASLFFITTTNDAFAVLLLLSLAVQTMVVFPIGNTWPEAMGWHIGCIFVATLSVTDMELA